MFQEIISFSKFTLNSELGILYIIRGMDIPRRCTWALPRCGRRITVQNRSWWICAERDRCSQEPSWRLGEYTSEVIAFYARAFADLIAGRWPSWDEPKAVWEDVPVLRRQRDIIARQWSAERRKGHHGGLFRPHEFVDLEPDMPQWPSPLREYRGRPELSQVAVQEDDRFFSLLKRINGCLVHAISETAMRSSRLQHNLRPFYDQPLHEHDRQHLECVYVSLRKGEPKPSLDSLRSARRALRRCMDRRALHVTPELNAEFLALGKQIRELEAEHYRVAKADWERECQDGPCRRPRRPGWMIDETPPRPLPPLKPVLERRHRAEGRVRKRELERAEDKLTAVRRWQASARPDVVVLHDDQTWECYRAVHIPYEYARRGELRVLGFSRFEAPVRGGWKRGRRVWTNEWWWCRPVSRGARC